jgi:hypothetical protein
MVVVQIVGVVIILVGLGLFSFDQLKGSRAKSDDAGVKAWQINVTGPPALILVVVGIALFVFPLTSIADRESSTAAVTDDPGSSTTSLSPAATGSSTTSIVSAIAGSSTTQPTTATTSPASGQLDALVAVVASVVVDGQTNVEYAVPKAPSLLVPPAECDEIEEWAVSQGAVLTSPQSDAGQVVVEVVVQGKSALAGSDIPVSITGLTVDVLDWKSPMAGSRVRCDIGLPLTDGPNSLSIVVTMPAIEDGVTHLEYFLDFEPLESFRRFELQAGETEYIDLIVDATSCLCEWTAKLHAVVDGEEVLFEVTDGGAPFRVTGGSRAAPLLVVSGVLTDDG